MRRFVYRSVRAVKLLVRDSRIPRPLRWLVGFGLLPVPGPFDEAVLLVAAGLLALFYRDRMREAWLTRAVPPADVVQAQVAGDSPGRR